MDKPRPLGELDTTNANVLITDMARYWTTRKIRKYLQNTPNDYPRFLYKYIRHDIPVEHLKNLLIDSDFYLSSPADFNDPFDTSARIVSEGSLKQRRQRWKEVILKHEPHLKRDALEVRVSQMMGSTTNRPEKFNEIFIKNMQACGVSCLSEDPRNILMWSHYASKHEGMVLQFELAKDIESLLYALKINYSDDYPTCNFAYDLSGQLEPVILGKAIGWAYEKEWRILRIGGAKTYHSFKPKALTGLIYGCRASNTLREKVNQLLLERATANHPNIKIYQATKHNSKYHVIIGK